MRFVLCGSSARKLKQHGTNLLAGWPSGARCIRSFSPSSARRSTSMRP
jgi:hypothetical protein